MTIAKLYKKYTYYKAMAEKRPYSLFKAQRPSIFLSNYLIFKERACYILSQIEAGKFNCLAHEMTMLRDMAGRSVVNENKSVKVQFYNIN